MVKRGVRESFTESDEKLVSSFVDHAVLWSKEKAQFHFTCGLVVEEDMRVQKVGKSYAPLPVRKEFGATSTDGAASDAATDTAPDTGDQEHLHGSKSYQSKRLFGELSGSPFFCFCRIFYFQCTENDGTVGVRKGGGCSWKIQSLKMRKTLTFQGPGLTMVLKWVK